MEKKKPRYIAIQVPMKSGEVKVYASPRIAAALAEVTCEMTIYKGVRLGQLLDAVYQQGCKDGARDAIESLDAKVMQIKKEIPYKNPGRPRTKKK